MTKKDNQNEFKFSLYQGNVLLSERVFNADQYNPFTRYFIDIRDILPKTIRKLQRTLSKKSYITQVDNDLDLYEYNMKIINSYPAKYRNDIEYNPMSITYKVEDKVIKGVECKMGLYLNNKPIVERTFYVDGFNPVSKCSLDVVEVVTEITDLIQTKIKNTDIKNTWDDYDLINNMGMNINQVRDLPPHKRNEFLSRIHRK